MGNCGVPYVAELKPGAWRVVVPRKGRLFPFVLAPVFDSRKAASDWLLSPEGQGLATADCLPNQKSAFEQRASRLAPPR